METKKRFFVISSAYVSPRPRLGCVVVVATATDTERVVTLNWRAEPHDPSKALILTAPSEVIIPIGEVGIVFEIETHDDNWGMIELTATLASPKDAVKVEIHAIPLDETILDTIDLPISMKGADANTTLATPPLRDPRAGDVWPITTMIRVTIEVQDHQTAHFVPKGLARRAMTVYKVNTTTGQRTPLPNARIVFDFDPGDPFISAQRDENAFVFHLVSADLPAGTYEVDIDINMRAHDSDHNYFGTGNLTVSFVK